MKYKHVIFDVDGTLLDSEFAVLSAWRDTLEELQNKVYSEDELLFTLGIPGEVTLARLGVADVDADPILKYMELEGITAKDAIYIGDSVYDYQCARSAGVDFGLAAWGKSFAQDIDAHFTLKHPKEVLEVVVSATR